jgi:hypothetical protein
MNKSIITVLTTGENDNSKLPTYNKHHVAIAKIVCTSIYSHKELTMQEIMDRE